MDSRQFFFKNRSYTPIPIVLLVIYYSQPSKPYIIIGLALIVAGELIRISAVRYAGGATRTRNVGAPYLCTSGPYSLTRNPLYCGNVIIYIGTVFFAGGIWMWHILPLVAIFFIFQYHLIISLEEETLKLANKIASKSSLILKIGKKAFYHQLELPLKKAYKYTSKIMSENMMTLDANEGISSFLEQRSPNWKNK